MALTLATRKISWRETGLIASRGQTEPYPSAPRPFSAQIPCAHATMPKLTSGFCQDYRATFHARIEAAKNGFPGNNQPAPAGRNHS